MENITFSEPLRSGRPAYERIARLQQLIKDCPDSSLRITMDLAETRTGLSFIFLLACLPYFAAVNSKTLFLTVDKKTFGLMQRIQVPGVRSLDGVETKERKTGFRILRSLADVVQLTEDIWSGFPVQTSEKLGGALKFNIGEVFNNASGHAEAKRIIGGWHTKPSGLYCFSCYDTGVGIPENVNRYREANGYERILDTQALKWALGRGHSTSTQRGRGLGLDMLKRFSIENEGAIHICSGSAYYILNKGSWRCIELSRRFHGTFFEMDIARNGKEYLFREEQNGY